VAPTKLRWQSKLVLLLVLPAVAAGVVLQAHFFAADAPIAIWTLGLSLLFGLVVYQLRAATPAAAFTGAAMTASLMFSTVLFPYKPWQTALVPLLAVFILSDIATRIGRTQKERLGIAERGDGRTASQVAANLGVAALVQLDLTQNSLANTSWFSLSGVAPMPLFAIALAALAEAAADTVSSEIGQVLGGRPRMITTLREADPGTDGAISLAGTLAGILAAAAVAAAGTAALHGNLTMFWISTAAAVFGLFFDSLLGATLERRGWLNNDAVNFLSTASAAACAMGLLFAVSHHA
jgi:uncharacterized protein (TIGR00297 family)